jgi:hypothetical protein
MIWFNGAMADRPAPAVDRPARLPGRPAGARPLAGLAALVLLAACSPLGAGSGSTAATGPRPGEVTASDQAGGAATVPSGSPRAPLLGEPRGETGGSVSGITLEEPPAVLQPPAAHVSPVPSLPPPTGAFALNLYRQGDFVSQFTFEWCVGASIQMTLNMVTAKDDRTRALQQRLWEQARDLSNSPFGGANPIGWTAALNTLGVGSYALVSEPDLDAALRRAAAAIRQTRRPAGLVMWSGRHAWMMSGFTSLGDPATVPNFEVTGVRVLDPLYPYGDDRWGASPPPNALLAPDQVGAQFVARLGGRVDLGIAPGYILVLPQIPA